MSKSLTILFPIYITASVLIIFSEISLFLLNISLILNIIILIKMKWNYDDKDNKSLYYFNNINLLENAFLVTVLVSGKKFSLLDYSLFEFWKIKCIYLYYIQNGDSFDFITMFKKKEKNIIKNLRMYQVLE